MNEQLQAGFAYTVEVLDAGGNVIETSVDHNLMPDEGIAYMLGTALKQGAPAPAWYVGLFSGAYTPTAGVTAATIATAASECTAYSADTRLPFALGAVTGGAVDNAASKAEFTFTSDVTIYGGFIVSAAAKNSTSGTLISVVRFASPKALSAGGVLRVTAGIVMASI